MKKNLLILAAAVMLILTGCGAKPSLAEWADGEKITETEKQINSLYDGTGLYVEFSAEGDDVLVFSCIYRKQLDLSSVTQEQMDATFSTQLSTLSSAMAPIFKECKRATGIKLSCIRMQYVNADGTVIYTQDFTN